MKGVIKMDKNKVIIFPDNFNLLNSNVKNLKIIVAKSMIDIINTLTFEGALEYEFRMISVKGTNVYIAIKGFNKVPVEPEKSFSNGSDSLYYAKHKDGNVSYLLQFLNSNSHTSQHSHEKTNEAYHSLIGSAYLNVEGSQVIGLVSGVS